MKLGKLIRNKERSSAKVLIKMLNMENNEWSISKGAIFEIEDKAFAENGFRMTYKAKSDDKTLRENTWVNKKYNTSSKETFERMGETFESQSRKRMHCCYYNFFRSYVDSYMIRQCFRFIKVLKLPTSRINWVIVRCPSPNKQFFWLAVSMHPHTFNGNVLFWYPFSLWCPSIERTQLGPTEENVLFVFIFLSVGILFLIPLDVHLSWLYILDPFWN